MSTFPTHAPAASLAHEITAALRRADRSTAQSLIRAADSALPLASAEAAMRDRRWDDAAWIFDQIPKRDIAASLKRCLCRNLAAMQVHRPHLYGLLTSLPRNDDCGIGTSATGHPTIVVRRADGQQLALSPGNRPLDALASGMALLKSVFESGQSFALCGMGDGYLLHQIAREPSRLFMDMEQCVFVLEPDAHVLFTALMIHDFTGPAGPIEQSRFQWFVGPDWQDDLRRAVLGDLFLPCPAISLSLGLCAAQVQQQLNAIVAELVDRTRRASESAERYYKSLSRAELADVFGPNPPRQPRVLLLTTRFSTVLQYSTRDAAAGFEQAGWQTCVLIEATPHHRILNAAIKSTLAEFKPDLVFQIDHQRSEHGTVFPPELPFVCWTQDHLPHLMSRKAGEAVGANDFVLTDAGPMYCQNFGYPARQVIPLSKLTAPPPLLPRSDRTAEDIVFVSNASFTPSQLRQRLFSDMQAADVEQPIFADCLDRVIALFSQGESLSTYTDVRQFLQQFLADRQLEMEQPRFDALVRTITHPVCDALYRQQALRWAITAADDAGLTLGFYGNHWDKHPEFSAFARGPVGAGTEFNALCRAACINLQVGLFPCLHQRLLDGVCSGAFFLVRGHAVDVAPQAMLDLLEAHCEPRIKTLEAARATIGQEHRAQFEMLLKECVRCLCPYGYEDPIEMVRSWQEAKLIVPLAGTLPHLEEISFTDAGSLRQRLMRFAREPDLRQEIVASQRKSIVSRLTYAAGLRRVTQRMGELLSPGSAKVTAGDFSRPQIGSAA